MANASHLSPDFVGYDVGIPQTTTPQVGYVGFLDFVGFPVGAGATPPTPQPTGNNKGGGTIINVHTRIDPLRRKRKREDDEILIL